MVSPQDKKTDQWLPKTAEGREQDGEGPLRNRGLLRENTDDIGI